MTLRHRAIAWSASLLPIVAFVSGGSEVGFTMYAESVEFKLEIVAHDRTGQSRAINPTELAPRVTPSAVPFFAGSDHFRRTYGQLPLRHHLREAGRLACSADQEGAASIEIALFERRRRGTLETRELVACGG